MSVIHEIALQLDAPESALVLGLFLIAFLITAFALFRWFGLVIGVGAILFAPVVYVLIGASFSNCPRFRSIPFGGCSYSDEVIALNIGFWAIAIFAVVLLGTKTARDAARAGRSKR